MKCLECQFDNREGVKFCEKCGAKMELVCPNCGAKIPFDRQFCGECGHNLTSPSEPVVKEVSFNEKLDKIQRYLPKGLTEKILAQRDKIEGERKQVTVMFCDMEGFTALSDKLGPEETYSIMDQVYEILIHKVHDYEGTVNEMTGDGVVALFGAPIALEDAPQRAIRTSLGIHREMTVFSDQMKQTNEGISTLKMRIGVHTGPVVVGTLGNNLRVEFKAVGDTVNLASRMEGLAEPGSTYITEETFKATEGLFRFEALGKREVKGKEEPINVYRVIAPSTRRTRFDVSAERGLTPFVGRNRELELLMDGFERCKEGRGQAFSIMAEAGLGKSRLLYEFRKSVANENVTFLEGKCLSYSRGVAYYPVIDVLKSNFDIREGEGDFEIRQKVKKGLEEIQADEASTLPYLLELLLVKNGGIDQTPLSPEIRKARTLDTLTRIVLKGSEIRPFIMAIEDLHWIDESSEESLKQLLESISGARVLLIFTYRPEFVHTWGGKSYHSQLNLNRLSNRESLLMVAHLLGTNEVAPDLENLILDKTEGVPFFVEEFIKSLKNLRLIELKEDRCQLTGQPQDLVIPSTIHDVIMARVDTLPEGAKKVLLRGSVIGREFSHELIKEITDLEEHERLSFLAALRDSELIYERGIYPACTYIFKHALTCELIYESILTKKKEKLHIEIGKAIEKIQSDRLQEFYEMLAYHYVKGQNLEKAYQYLKLSGNKATNNYANNEALGFYRQALESLKKMPETLENKKKQLGLRMTMWRPIEFLGFPEGSLEILMHGKKLAQEIGDKRSLALTYSKIGNYYIVMGDKLEAIEYSAKGFEEAEKNEDVDLMAPIGLELMLSTYLYGDCIKAIDIGSKVIHTIEDKKRESDFFGRPFNVYTELHGQCGFSLAFLGKFKEAEAIVRKGLHFAKVIEHLPSIAIAEFILASVFAFKGDGSNAIKRGEAAFKHFTEAEVVLLLPLTNAALGWGSFFMEELHIANEYFQKAFQIQKDMGAQLWMSFIYIGHGLVEMELKNLETAQSDFEKALAFAQNNSERPFEGWAWTLLGRILGKKKPVQFDKAEECISKGIKMLNDMKTKPYLSQGHLFLGDLYSDMGQKEESLKHLRKAEGMFQEMGMDYWLDKTKELLERL